MQGKDYFFSLFRTDEAMLGRLIAKCLEHGGSYADLYFENTASGRLLLRDGEVSSGGLNIDYGAGFRTLNGEKTGYAYSESTDMKSMLEAASAASQIARGMVPGRRLSFGSASHAGNRPDFYPISRDWREAQAEGFVPMMKELRAKVMDKDKRAVKVTVSLTYSTSEIMMYNSLRELVTDVRPLGTLSVSVVFKQDGSIESRGVSRSFRAGVEMLTPGLLEELANEAVSGIDERFAAKRPKGGKMPVVMGAGASGILLHEAVGHAFEADFNRKGQSVFSEKMGRKVCGESITIVDDGTVPASRGAVNYDDEGVPGQKTLMVTDGVLTSYLHDRISAGYYGVTPTGNGRRESFRYAPIPRMRATYMENGKASKEDIIASVKEGIYVDQFSNGQVQIGEGDFTFFVKSGRLIENGRLTMPVKDINVIGNGPQALADIVAVGNDLKIDESAWTCGKGQSCPVSCGIPTVLVKALTVGGV